MKLDSLTTPFFLIDESRLESNLQLLKYVSESAKVEIILALKGFANWSVFPLVRKYLKAATASSLNEALLCNEFMKARAHTYAVAYDPQEIESILEASSHMTFNSIQQFELFRRKAHELGLSCGLRVNPEKSDVETKLYNPSSPNSRLGITANQLERGLPEGIEGLHFHVLCESDSYALEEVLNAFENKFGHLLKGIKWVNFGGGHAITRADYNIDHLINLLINFRKKHNINIILEPGSAVAWQCGELYSTVLDIVENGGVKTAIIDASFTCHMPDCLEMPYRPEIRGAGSGEQSNGIKYRIGGVSCLAGDYLDEYYFDADLQIGDKLIFEDMVHYTMVKTTTFNGVKHPSIVNRSLEGEVRLVKKFGYEDYKNRLS